MRSFRRGDKVRYLLVDRNRRETWRKGEVHYNSRGWIVIVSGPTWGTTVTRRREDVRFDLTDAQARYLAEIEASPGKRYNGRARKSMEALEAAGLITYEYDLQPHATGKWTEWFIPKLVD